MFTDKAKGDLADNQFKSPFKFCSKKFLQFSYDF